MCWQRLDEPLDFAKPELMSSGAYLLAPVAMDSTEVYSLSVTNTGRFAFATSIAAAASDLLTPDMSSSGLVTAFAASSQEALQFLQAVARETKPGTRGFNIVVGDGVSVAYWSNGCPAQPTVLAPGVYVLSNGLLNTPWPKCEYLRGRLAKKTATFLASTFAASARLAIVPGADGIRASRKENYDICDSVLQVLCDQHHVLGDARFHALPSDELAPLAASVFLPPVVISPSTYFGTQTSIVAVIAPFGECLFAQRSLSSRFTGPLDSWNLSSLYSRRDVVFDRVATVKKMK